jgi:NADH-quinone oxidoreductase subunit N
MFQPTLTILNELLLVLLALAVFSLGLLRSKPTEGKGEVILTAAGLLFLLGLSFAGIQFGQSAFGGAYQGGALELVFKRLFLLAGLLMALLSWPTRRKTDVLPFRYMGEYLGLMLLSLTGMCFLVSARELVLLYVSLELVTIPLILLVAMNRRELRSAEAGMKYVLFSALSSGLLLYGLSLVYGMTGTTFLAEIAGKLTFSPLAAVALIMVMAGVGFKISAVPFHLWTPDTYEGAPVTVTAFMSVASKAAGFVLFYKVIAEIFGRDNSAQLVLVSMLATLTMTFGNLAALHQTNMKRFLAFSSIAQAGYLMIGLTHSGDTGRTAVVYYLLVYLFSNMAAFGVVTMVAAGTGKEDLREYAGLSETNPRLALVMMLAMFSLAGIPPLAGFLGKFYLFAAAAEKHLYWLVFVGAVNATISLYYYLVVVKWMYIMKPAEGGQPIERIELAWAGRAVLVFTTAGMLLVGILPQFIRWTELAAAVGF